MSANKDGNLQSGTSYSISSMGLTFFDPNFLGHFGTSFFWPVVVASYAANSVIRPSSGFYPLPAAGLRIASFSCPLIQSLIPKYLAIRLFLSDSGSFSPLRLVSSRFHFFPVTFFSFPSYCIFFFYYYLRLLSVALSFSPPVPLFFFSDVPRHSSRRIPPLTLTLLFPFLQTDCHSTS